MTMSKLKLMTIVGTRPEIIRLSEIIKKSDQYFQHTLVHTGQNWDERLNEIFFQDLSIRNPDYYLDVVGEHLGETIGNVITKSYKLLADEKPDAILILGDTNSSLAAISAKRLKIPIFHMEAGNRCFDQNVPEEINRKIVDHISDINLPYTDHSRRYLAAEGFRKDHIIVTGSPMAEVIAAHRDKIEKSKILESLNLVQRKYILLSCHREENVDAPENFTEIVNSVNHLAEKYRLPVVFSTHPRTKKFIDQRKIKFNDLVVNLKPFSFTDYCKLQQNAKCVVSDSGTLAEESALLNIPAVSIRTSTERPESIEKANMIIGGIKARKLLQAVEIAIDMKQRSPAGTIPSDYGDQNVSDKIIKIVQGYTNVINREVWRKKG